MRIPEPARSQITIAIAVFISEKRATAHDMDSGRIQGLKCKEGTKPVLKDQI